MMNEWVYTVGIIELKHIKILLLDKKRGNAKMFDVYFWITIFVGWKGTERNGVVHFFGGQFAF